MDDFFRDSPEKENYQTHGFPWQPISWNDLWGMISSTNLATLLHKDGGLVLGDNCPDGEGGIEEEEKDEEEG